jgi:SsrA-binding protein
VPWPTIRNRESSGVLESTAVWSEGNAFIMATSASNDRIVSKNKRASFDYELGERFEAGLVLIGSEARSLRAHSADLRDAWVDVDTGGEAWVKGLKIPELNHAAFGHDEKRPRKLLLHSAQIQKLRGKVQAEGMTLVVTQCYFKQGRVKIEIALARGKKKYDKRHAEKERMATREAQAAIRRVHRP